MKNNNLYLIRIPVLCALCATVFVFVAADSALAQDWRFEPKFKVGAEFDDNATLNARTDQEVDLSGFLADVRAGIFYASPTTSFSAEPRVLVRNYNDDVVLDSDDYFLRSDFRRRTGLSTFGFRVNLDLQSVRNGERLDTDLEIEDPDEITDDDTGRVFRIGTREKWRVFPYWVYQLSDASSIRADFGYTDTQYDDIFAGTLDDYSDARLNLKYRRSLSNVTTWGIWLSGRKYDSEGLSEEISGQGVLVEIQHALSEKTRVAARIGLEDTDQPGFETDPDVTGAVTLTRNLESIRFFAQFRRSVYGSGAGNVSVRDSMNLNFRRRLNEKISAGLGVRAYQTRNVSSSTLVEDRNYVQLQWNLNWHLSRSFVIEADYRYTVIDRGETRGGRANSNQVILWFTFQPNTIPEI